MKLQQNRPLIIKSSIVLTLLIILIPVVFNGINYSCEIQSYRIDPEELQSINSLADNNYYEEARKELIAAIKKSSASPEKTAVDTGEIKDIIDFISNKKYKDAEKKMTEINNKASGYEVARSLLESGFYEEAKKEMLTVKKEALKKHIPPTLYYLAENSFDPNWGQFGKYIATRNQLLDQIDIKALCSNKLTLDLISGCYLTAIEITEAKWKISPVSYWLKNIPLIIGSIFASCVLLYYSSDKTTYLNIEDFNDESIDLKIGKGTTSTLKTLFLENELGTNNAVNVAISPAEKLESPIENKEITILLKLINWAFSLSSFTLSGYYQESRKKGIGLKLVLKDSKGEIYKEDFWQQDYDTINQYEAKYLHELLAIPASIWVMSKLNSENFENWLSFNTLTKSNSKDQQKYNSWKSFAYSKVGSYWYRKGNSNKLEGMLHKSLMYNSNNRFALFTLGVLKMEQAIEKKEYKLFDEAGENLEYAKKLSGSIENSLGAEFSTSPVWYKSIFQLLSIELYKKLLSLSSKKFTNEEFLKEGKNLVNAVEYYQYQARKKSFPLSDFLDEFEVMAKILYASILVDSNQSGHEMQITEIESKYQMASFDDSGNLLLIEKEEKQYNDKILLLNPLVYYNLACYYALLCMKRCEKYQKDENLSFLCKAYYGIIENSSNYLCYKNCRAYREKECLKSNKDKIFLYLKYAVKQNKKLNEWSKIDPSFKWIKEHDKLQLEFYYCVNDLKFPPDL
jgi:hypothetical protein